MKAEEVADDNPTIAIDAQSLNDIYRNYRGLIFFVIATYVPQKEDAEDVYQEVFLRLLSSRGRFFAKRALKVYLCKAAKSCAIDFVKKKISYVPNEVFDGFGENDPHNPALEDIGYGLSSQESILVNYRITYGFAWKDICQITGVPMSSAKRVYRNAILKIKRSQKHDLQKRD
jgi:RNA polymerase sigma factor (sigma-70 family)